MRTETKLGLAASLVAALLGGPSSTAAQYEEWEQRWGDCADPMDLARQRAWITNLGRAVPSNTEDPCYGILSAAHEGAQRASEPSSIAPSRCPAPG